MSAPSVAECVDEAGAVFAQALIARDALSVEDAARAAWTPTGPSIAELEAEIRGSRAATRVGAA